MKLYLCYFYFTWILCLNFRKNIGAGSKLTVLEKEFWCQQCVTEAERARLSKLNGPDGRLKDSITKADTKVPPVDANSERPQEIAIRQNQLNSPDSAFAGDCEYELTKTWGHEKSWSHKLSCHDFTKSWSLEIIKSSSHELPSRDVMKLPSREFRKSWIHEFTKSWSHVITKS